MIGDITQEEQTIYDLRVKIGQLHGVIGRMFKKGFITEDMIKEALDNNISPDDYDSLKVIWNSWGGNPHHNIRAVPDFKHILKTIRSYQ